MSIATSILPELEEEMASTRKVLERVPDDKLTWKAHPKSNSIGWVASHLVEIIGWVEGVMTRPDWDVNPADGESYKTPVLNSRQEMLTLFDQNVATAKRAIAAASDETFGEAWSLLAAGKPLFTMSRLAVIRTFVLNHTIHHRGHLLVYLRLNDIPVPGMYGPSGDED